jgi:hypothetical protein
MNEFEVDFLFEDLRIIMPVIANDEYEAEIIAQDKLMENGIDTTKLFLYETTINQKEN